MTQLGFRQLLASEVRRRDQRREHDEVAAVSARVTVTHVAVGGRFADEGTDEIRPAH